MIAGYSKTPLIKKLGIKPGHRVRLLNPPEGYLQHLGDLPSDAHLVREAAQQADFIQFFTKDKAALEERFPQLKATLALDGLLWISWPKKASKVDTDLNENIVRQIGLANGLVDVKVAAIDSVWSGLKFVYRLEDRY